MTDQQTSRTNITEALDVAAQVAYEMSVFLHGAEMAPPVAPGWLAKIREWQARLAASPARGALTAPDEPTLRAAVSAAWAALRNDVLNPDSPFPASVDDLFRVGRYNVERAYDALIEARAASASVPPLDVAALHALERDLAWNKAGTLGEVWHRLRAILDEPEQQAVADRIAAAETPEQGRGDE